MKKEEYKIKKEEILKRHSLELSDFNRKVAFNNNPYKIGDIITDHCCTIKIEKIQFTTSYDSFPICVYTGVKLNKDLSENKLGKKEKIFQTNIIK